jgi:hypothetical protein
VADFDINQLVSSLGVGGVAIFLCWRTFSGLAARFVGALEQCVKMLTTLDERTRTDSDRLARVEERLHKRRRAPHDTEET